MLGDTESLMMNIKSFQGDKDVPLPKSKNFLVLLHPSTMKRLHLQVGSSTLLKTLKGRLLLKSWPCDLLEGSTAALPGFSLFKHYVVSQSNIKPYKGEVLTAERVFLSSSKHKPFMDSKAFKQFLQNYLDQLHIKVGTVLHLEYLRFPFCCTVKKIDSSEDSALLSDKLKNHSDSNASLNISDIVDAEFREKCDTSKSLNYKAIFQSSTPMSSPKVSTQTKTGFQDLKCSDLEGFSSVSVKEKFYRMNKKTKVFVENLQSVQSQSSLSFKDIGGLSEQINDIKSSVDQVLSMGADTELRSILITGPSGTGKSMIAQALQTEYTHELPVYIVNKNLFRSEGSVVAQLKRIFEEVQENSPSILFLDNIEQLCETNKFPDKYKDDSIQNQEISSKIRNLLISVSGVLVIATSQDKTSIHANLKKHGIFQKEIWFPIPSSTERTQIFDKILKRFVNVLTPQEVLDISEMAHGFTGGDLKRLCEKASKSLNSLTFLDLKKALKFIKPSSMAELEFKVPNVRMSDVGGMYEVKEAIKDMVEWQVKNREQCKKINYTPSRGMLLYGPPGCSKTMIVKALASESQLNFIYIKDSQVFSMYVGDSEKAVSNIFRKAREAAPCILFFDEIESVAPKRDSSSGNSSVAEKVKTQLLIELDGIDVLEEGVCVIAATNRPHMIEPALLRPGRLDQLIYVSLPDTHTRKDIFKVILEKKPCSSDIDLSYLADKTEGYSGAEIDDICNQAAQLAMKEDIISTTTVLHMKHLLEVLISTKPRTTPEMIECFENYKNNKMIKY